MQGNKPRGIVHVPIINQLSKKKNLIKKYEAKRSYTKQRVSNIMLVAGGDLIR